MYNWLSVDRRGERTKRKATLFLSSPRVGQQPYQVAAAVGPEFVVLVFVLRDEPPDPSGERRVRQTTHRASRGGVELSEQRGLLPLLRRGLR